VLKHRIFSRFRCVANEVVGEEAYGYAERMLSAIGPAPRMTTGVARTVNR
jgi:hypothetical protein